MCKHLRMQPDEDPEARIRELERPLADQAHSSELGTRPYEAPPSTDVPVPSYPYNPQPGPYQQTRYQYRAPHYDSPYHSPPQQVVHKRSPTIWLIALALGIVTVGAVATLVFFRLVEPATPPAPQSQSPGFSGGGSTDRSEDFLTVEAGDTLSMGGFEQNKTIVCNQGTVNISGMTNTIDIRGDCASISVSGMNNVITVESAQSIAASGFDNQVTYRAGTPEVSKSGSGNTIEQG